ncbi:MAG: glycosyltransferase family 4 protein [Ignavibacteria bacterium]|nr:glycosyltransferase family 4 protein [Ignavibacteria bacterium]
MPLLHLINSVARGGRELYVRDLILELQKAGVENFVVCRKFSVIDEACENAGIPVIHTSTNLKFSFIEVLRLRAFIQKNGVNVIFSHTRNDVFTGALLKKLTGTKHLHAVYMGTGPKKDFVHRFVYGSVDALITSSEFSKRECENYLPVPTGAVNLVRYGRHTGNYKVSVETRNRIRREMKTPDEKIVVAVMSRIDSGKGVGIFAEALQYLEPGISSKVEFWIMGEPTVKEVDDTGKVVYEEQADLLYSKLKELAKNNPASLKLIPFQKDYISWLSAMDIFVLPTHNEMYSLSVIDAMMTGLPVIGTDAGGTTEQIGNNERGILVEPGSSKAIAEAISEFINHPETIKIKGDNARLWASSQHNFNTTIGKILSLLPNQKQISS